MKKRILSILLCLVMLLGLIPAAALAEETVPTPISSIAATITAPAIGETPAATATLTPADGLTCGTVYWFKLSDSKNPETASAEDWSKMSEDDTFDEDHYYKVNISLSPNTGFSFATDVSGSVNKESCTVTNYGFMAALTRIFTSLEAPAPAYPDYDDITNLDKIQIGMICSQDPQGHSKFYGLLDGGTISSGQAEKKDGVYQFTLTINPAIYLAQYNKDTGIKHEFVTAPEKIDLDSLSIVVKYDSEKKEWSAVPNNEDMVQLGLFVKCEAPAPAYPDLDDITNLDKIQIGMLCSQDPQGHSKFYGLLDGGTTSSGQAEKKDGVYQFTLTINPAIYLAQYNKDTGIKHEFVKEPDSLSIVVKYDSEKMEWSAVPNNEDMVQLGLFVKCDEHVVEYTVSFDKNGGTGTMDSVMVEEGAEYTLPECKFTAPAGKVFKAWSVNGTEKSVGDKITVNADTTVTAVWKVKLTPYVPGHTHSYTKAVTAPTCTDKGYTTYTCSCGNSYVSDYVNANGHTEVVDAAVAATCEKTGLTEGKHCSVCNAVLTAQKATPKAAHTEVVDAAVAATCEKTGLTEGKHCSVCNAVLTAQKETPKAAHSFDKGFCSVCGAVDASYVPFKDVKEGDAFYDDIMWAWKNHIIVGDENGNYNADDDLTRAQVVTMLWRMSGSPKAEKAAGFSDLTQDWYKEAVAWAVEKGIVKGIGNNLFDPDGTCTRAMFVTMLWRLNGFETAENAAPFTDLTQDWYKAAVAWASSNGVTKGTSSTTFSPDDNCTRGQAAAFLHRLAQLEK